MPKYFLKLFASCLWKQLKINQENLISRLYSHSPLFIKHALCLKDYFSQSLTTPAAAANSFHLNKDDQSASLEKGTEFHSSLKGSLEKMVLASGSDLGNYSSSCSPRTSHVVLLSSSKEMILLLLPR